VKRQAGRDVCTAFADNIFVYLFLFRNYERKTHVLHGCREEGKLNGPAVHLVTI
jgi:hypothetical protein